MLAGLPTEENYISLFDFPRKIDQTEIDILEKTAMRFNCLRRFSHPTGQVAEFRVTVDYRGQLHPLDCRILDRYRLDFRAQFAGCPLQLLEQWGDNRNQRIGLARIE